MKKLMIIGLLASTLGAPAFAEDIAIVGGTAHTMGSAGVIENATVLVSDGKIKAIGAGLQVPDGYRQIDASGKIVTPGLFSPFSSLGLADVTLSGGREDYEAPDAPFSAGLDISYAINANSPIIANTRIEGVTRAATSPKISRSVYAGQGALIALGDGPDLVTNARAFMFADVSDAGAEYGGGSHASAWTMLRAGLEEADKGIEAGAGEPLYTAIDHAALEKVADGDMLLIIRANRQIEIAQVIRLSEDYPKLNLAILDGREAWSLAAELAAAKIPVILHGFLNLPADFDSLGATQTNAAQLHAAGVLIAITNAFGDGGLHNVRLIPQIAGNAVANGLPKDAALAAITVNPAKIFGVDGTVGSLAPGNVGDVVVWDGDPLEVMSAPTVVLIDGEDIPLVSRQTKLRDRYLGLDPGDKTYHYKR